MKKAELMKMVENMAEDEELVFIGTKEDRDGWEEETTEYVIRVESKTEYINKERAEAKAFAEKKIAEAKAENARLEAEIAEEKKETKASAKRNKERNTLIEWNKEIIRRFETA